MTSTLAFVQGIGVTELLIVLAIVLLIIGPKRLPSLGRQLGGGLREFKDSVRSRDKDPELAAPADEQELDGEVVREPGR